MTEKDNANDKDGFGYPLLGDGGLIVCPFCGGNAEEREYGDSLTISCNDCQANIGDWIHSDRREMIKAWNKRTAVGTPIER